MVKSNGLTDLQQQFIEQYFLCRFNATQAYIKAGYQSKYPGPDAGKTLNNPKVRAAIDERLKAETIGANEALRLLADHATGDLAVFMDDTGYVDIAAIKASGKTHLIKEWEQWEHVGEDGETHQGRVKIKLYDAQSALKELIKLYRLDDNKPTDNLGIKVTVEYADYNPKTS